MTTYANSDLIAGLDASPIVRPNAGQGAPARVVEQTAVILAGATDATTVVYRMVRVPTFAIIKRVEIALELNAGTATTFTGSLGLYWSDAGSAVDGTPAGNVGNLVSDAFFAHTLAAAAIVTLTDETFQNAAGNSVTDGFYVPSASFQPLWVALTSGGYQGLNTLNVPKGPADGLWGGLGATSGSTDAFYQLSKDPGGFLDICWRPTTANSLSKAMNFIVRVQYAMGG